MPFNAALSGLQTANSELRILSNNIANTSTTGYKRSRAELRDVFAAGALGATSNAIGTGVKLANVSQVFTQGNIKSEGTSLDMAVNGNGFFVLDKNGSRIYSRNGAFLVDKEGNVSDSQSNKLVGFLADSNGTITGAQGTLKIENSNLAPKVTANASMQLNLDANATPPPVDFVRGFTAANPPNPNTFNNSTSTQVFDSLGTEHVLTSYYVKSPSERQWNVYLGLDGVDITPAADAAPAGGISGNGVNYNSGEIAAPYTLVFDTAGQFIPNNIASPPQHFGSADVISSDETLKNSGELSTLDIGDFTVNGVSIEVSTVTDTFSTTDASASMITIAKAINDKTSEHKVTATVEPTVFTAVSGSYPNTTLTSGQLTLNGVEITGATGGTTAADLATLINGSNVPGIVADGSSGELVLTAADGRNIQLETTGSVVGLSFGTQFDASAATALDKVKRGNVKLEITNDRSITIGGNRPEDINFTSGTKSGIFQNNSDLMNVTFNPGNGATSPQTINIDFSATSQFSSPFSILSLEQDGYATGRLSGINVDSSGIISANYGNGQSLKLGQVALANFRNVNGLQQQGDTTWAETFSSGAALLGSPGTSDLGLIQSGALEDSNVQLTDELVGLIVAQRNFQANAQTIRTADAVTQTIINIR